MKNKNLPLIGIIAFTILFIASAVIFKIYEVEVLPSQFYGALIAVVLTAIITLFLLQGQSAHEIQREKDIKIFDAKIKVYSEFIQKMWAIASADNLVDKGVSQDGLKELRTICFSKIIFYLNKNQIEKLSDLIDGIDGDGVDNVRYAFAEITEVLKADLGENSGGHSGGHSGSLMNLFNSFEKNGGEESDASKEEEVQENKTHLTDAPLQDVVYWHFNILDVGKQLKAFEKDNWVLALIEYKQEWRTNLIRKVKPNDVIFLFKRGGAGYIGAFRALDPPAKILSGKERETYSKSDIEKYDIYGGMADGASFSSNILVKPIAFNYIGVKYLTVRRRTIERVNNETRLFLLNRFNGKDLEQDRLIGQGKLNEETTIPLDTAYFQHILKLNNLE